MILLADSGTTKCDWIFVDKLKYEHQFDMQTTGLNPSYNTENEISGIINSSNDFLAIKSHVEKIYFFGAGCGVESTKNKMKQILGRLFYNCKEIYVAGDIEGAVYACTNTNAVVGVLGTGSHCCYFNGQEIIYKVPSLGFYLMDDGGGNGIGRDCLRAYYFKKMPEELAKKFESQFETNPEKIKKELYEGSHASQFLASYTPFAYENIDNAFIRQLVEKQLRSFFDNLLSNYKEELAKYPLHFTGSVAYYFKDTINTLCIEYGYHLEEIIQRPIKNLATKIDDISKLML